jgi:hypothetical protein
MKALLATLAVILVLHTVSPAAYAEDPEVLDLQIDQRQTVTVGDRVRYRITIEADAGTGVSLAASALPFEVELVAPPRLTSRDVADGRIEITMSFELAPFVPGDIRLPPLPLVYTNADGASGSIEAPGSIISVASVLPQGGDVTPRDLKPQAEIGTPPSSWLIPAVAALAIAVVALVALAVWRHRVLKRRAAYVPVEEPAVLGPEDRARQVLDRIGAEFLAHRDYEAYYTAIAVTVRQYLTARYGFPAFALTTRELEAEMARRGIDRWQLRVTSGLLSQCDAVVYAHYRPAMERADADLTAAYEIVEMSRPLERQPDVQEVTAS